VMVVPLLLSAISRGVEVGYAWLVYGKLRSALRGDDEPGRVFDWSSRRKGALAFHSNQTRHVLLLLIRILVSTHITAFTKRWIPWRYGASSSFIVPSCWMLGAPTLR
jgi:hypothetical protein